MDLDNFEDVIHDHERPAIQPAACADGDTKQQNETQSIFKTVEPGLYDGISNYDYSKIEGVRSSNLKHAIKSMHIYQRHHDGSILFKPTKAMDLGTVVHKMVLEAFDFSTDIVISKKWGRKASDKEEKAAFYAEHLGKTIIDSEQHDQARRMRDSLMKLPEIHHIFKAGSPELSGVYRDPYSDVLCKYRPDWRTDWCLSDVKTTKDVSPDKFNKTIHDYGYHISAAHYLEGDSVLRGTNHRKFIFLCVEPEYPYEAAMYKLGDQSLILGERLRKLALTRIQRSLNNDIWPRINGGITQEIDVPYWALKLLKDLD